MQRKTVFLAALATAAVVLSVAAGGGGVATLTQWEAWQDDFAINDDGTAVPKACSPVGTWYGSTEMGDELVLTITKIGPGHYFVISDGVNGSANGYGDRSSMRGELLSVGGQYRLSQIGTIGERDFVDHDPPQDSKAKPVIVGMAGNLEIEDCANLLIRYNDIGVYVWGSEPFVDDPFVTYPPCCGHFKRMLNDLW